MGDARLLDTAEVGTPPLCDVVTTVPFEVPPCADEVGLVAPDDAEVGGADDALEDPLDAVEDGAVVTDVLVEDGGGEDAGTEEDDGGVLELDPPLGTATTTPPCTFPLACVDVPAALDL